MATLFVVATPIGNLEDLTRRAVRVLGEVDRVLAEDTRRTKTLLAHLGIGKPLTSLHAHNETGRVGQVLGWLDAGDDLAFVSDAGTPLLSDPGARLVAAVVAAGHSVVPLPGASAVLAALVVSGLPPQPFTFIGFPPRKGADRARVLAGVAQAEHTTVLFESPERLQRLLADLVSVCGEERSIVVARELTKLYETVIRGTLSEVASYYEGEAVRGEVTVVVGPAPPAVTPDDLSDARALARTLLDVGASPSRAAREVARLSGIARNRAYALVQELGETKSTGSDRE